MFERFTHAARTAVVRAQEEAREQGSPTIGAAHLLFGVLTDRGGVPAVVLGRSGVTAAAVSAALGRADHLDDEALSAVGIDLDEVRRRAEDAFGPGALDRPTGRAPWGRRRANGHIPFTPEAKAALVEALRAAVFFGDREIGSAQLFLGLLTDNDVVLTLRRLGVDASTEELISSVRSQLRQAA